MKNFICRELRLDDDHLLNANPHLREKVIQAFYVITCSPTIDEHVKHIESILTMHSMYGLKLNTKRVSGFNLTYDIWDMKSQRVA